MDRRGFLGLMPAVAWAAPALGKHLGGAPALDALGVQLYTLRSEMVEDPDRTLATLAEIGYREVEAHGNLYGLTPHELRAKADATGLRVTSTHTSVADVRDRWPDVLEGAQELGLRLIVVPSIPRGEQGAEGLKAVADDFNRGGEAARSAGIRFGYHNHSWEFSPLEDGTLPIELLLDRTDPALVDWQMDIYWAVDGGADVGAYVEAASGRVTSVHLKDRTVAGAMVDVGDGVIDYAQLIPLAERHGMRHAFVEHDQPTDAMDSISRSFRHLRSLGMTGRP